jgi:hypothetical protein
MGFFQGPRQDSRLHQRDGEEHYVWKIAAIAHRGAGPLTLLDSKLQQNKHHMHTRLHTLLLAKTVAATLVL